MEKVTINEIAIIGAGGKMGTWFTTFFLNLNFNRISLFDKKLVHNHFGEQNKDKIFITDDIHSCIKNADLIIICVPVPHVPKIVLECSKNAKHGAIISEISSIKKQSFDSLINIRKDLTPLCIHPMFGPGAKKIDNMRIIMIPVRNKKYESFLTKKIFQGAEIVQATSPETHDRIISVVLGLTHYMNLVFANCISNFDYDEFKKYSGTTFKMQSIISESIFTDNSQLMISLLFFNPLLLDEIRFFLQEANKIYNLISKDDKKEFIDLFGKIQSFFEKNNDPNISYKKLYDAMKIIDETNYD